MLKEIKLVSFKTSEIKEVKLVFFKTSEPQLTLTADLTQSEGGGRK